MDLHNNPGGEMNQDRHTELAAILEERRRGLFSHCFVARKP